MTTIPLKSSMIDELQIKETPPNEGEQWRNEEDENNIEDDDEDSDDPDHYTTDTLDLAEIAKSKSKT